MEFLKKNIKWIELAGCVLVIISLFLPFATVSVEFLGSSISESVSYIEGDGIIVFAAVIVAGVLIFLKKEVFSLIPLGISTVISIYSAINVGGEFEGVEALYDGLKVGFSIGFYLLLVGLLIAIGSVCYSHFALKKNTSTDNNQIYNQGVQQTTSQDFQQYNYNQPVQPMGQPNYGQAFVNGTSNEDSVTVGVSNSAVDTNIFHQSPVAQPSSIMENPVQSNIVEQPVMNNVQQSVVPEFINPGVITCPQCKATLNSDMKFCNQCGSKLN